MSGWSRQLQLREESVIRVLTWRMSIRFRLLGIWKMSQWIVNFVLSLKESWRTVNTGKIRKNTPTILALGTPSSPFFLTCEISLELPSLVVRHTDFAPFGISGQIDSRWVQGLTFLAFLGPIFWHVQRLTFGISSTFRQSSSQQTHLFEKSESFLQGN